MKILIVGASGLVGSHCYKFFTSKGFETLGTHVNFSTEYTIHFNPSESQFEINVCLSGFKPNVIVHCGALTNVDYCETNEEDSYISTVQSVINLVGYCKVNNCKLIYLSTDYVFDGQKGPYTEDADVNPINIYGKHKLIAEQHVSTLNNFIIARITNVYGEEARAKNFIERLLIWLTTNEKKVLNLPYDQFATPVYAGDIAKMLFNLLVDNKNGIYHLSSTDYCTRFQLAARVKGYFPNNESVQIASSSTHSLKQPAKRPLFGGMLSNKFIKEYPDFLFTSVDKYISDYIKKCQ
ncbi:MAG: SDR family oxidoreductase [Flavobacterium sp.]|nr:SDR family oxidoreductase [Flavobacterium sp.]